MANERNVEALARVLYEVGVAERSLALAETLAADRAEIALCVREGLEHIATGDTYA